MILLHCIQKHDTRTRPTHGRRATAPTAIFIFRYCEVRTGDLPRSISRPLATLSPPLIPNIISIALNFLIKNLFKIWKKLFYPLKILIYPRDFEILTLLICEHKTQI